MIHWLAPNCQSTVLCSTLQYYTVQWTDWEPGSESFTAQYITVQYTVLSTVQYNDTVLYNTMGQTATAGSSDEWMMNGRLSTPHLTWLGGWSHSIRLMEKYY